MPPSKVRVQYFVQAKPMLVNPKYVAGVFNVIKGTENVVFGARLMLLGVSADVTGVGALIMAPVELWGTWEFVTGGARTIRGVNQLVEGIKTPWVSSDLPPWLTSVALGVLPAGDNVINFLGGF
jgi:hypothetical protein